MELDPLYVDVAIRRWQAFTGKEAILSGTAMTFSQIAEKRAAGLAQGDRDAPRAATGSMPPDDEPGAPDARTPVPRDARVGPADDDPADVGDAHDLPRPTPASGADSAPPSSQPTPREA